MCSHDEILLCNVSKHCSLRYQLEVNQSRKTMCLKVKVKVVV